MSGGSLNSTQWLGGTGPNGNSEESAALKTELRENEERWIKLRVEFDSFRREVGRALDVDELDVGVLLEELQSHVKRHRHHGPTALRSGDRHHDADRHGISGGHRANTSKGAIAKGGRHRPQSDSSDTRHHRAGSSHHQHDHQHDEADYQKVKRRLQTALQTIESQDLWIELLNRKLSATGGDTTGGRMDHGQTGGSSRPGSPMRPPSCAAYAGSGMHMQGEVAALKNEVLDLEARLQKHIEFREKVIQVLGLRAISAPDYEILQTIEGLLRKAQRLDRLDIPSASPAASQSLSFAPGTGYGSGKRY